MPGVCNLLWWHRNASKTYSLVDDWGQPNFHFYIKAYWRICNKNWRSCALRLRNEKNCERRKMRFSRKETLHHLSFKAINLQVLSIRTENHKKRKIRISLHQRVPRHRQWRTASKGLLQKPTWTIKNIKHVSQLYVTESPSPLYSHFVFLPL